MVVTILHGGGVTRKRLGDLDCKWMIPAIDVWVESGAFSLRNTN